MTVLPSSKRLLGVAGGLTCAGVLGVLASIAGPSFLKNRPRARQAEIAYTLKVLLTQAQEFHRAEGRWATSPRQLVEYVASAPQTCTCFLGPDSRWGGKGARVAVDYGRLPPAVREQLGANSAAAPEFVIACAVNLDEDEALDVWTISSADPVPRIRFADLGE